MGDFDLTGIRYGAIGSVSRYFNRYVGVQFEGDYHNDNNEQRSTSSDFEGGSGGLNPAVPDRKIHAICPCSCRWRECGQLLLQQSVGVVLTGGGGLDYNTPLFNHHLGFRLVRQITSSTTRI